jgi:predicted aspartyl protease
MIAASMLEEIGIEPTKRQIFEYANGARTELDMAPIMVRIDGDETPTWVIFGEEGSSPILGAHALEGLLLGVDPYGQRLIPIHGLLK